eukprot:ctg_478.g244
MEKRARYTGVRAEWPSAPLSAELATVALPSRPARGVTLEPGESTTVFADRKRFAVVGRRRQQPGDRYRGHAEVRRSCDLGSRGGAGAGGACVRCAGRSGHCDREPGEHCGVATHHQAIADGESAASEAAARPGCGRVPQPDRRLLRHVAGQVAAGRAPVCGAGDQGVQTGAAAIPAGVSRRRRRASASNGLRAGCSLI